VPWRERLAYATPAVALAAVGIPVYVHLPKFYTDVVGVSVGTIGALILAARLFDAVSDPLVGWLSDRLRGRHGRRRPLIAVAAVPLAISFALLFSPPDAGAATSSIWFGFWLFATFLFWTLVTVPYEALGPELTTDYDERTTILGMRDGFLIFGTLLAAAAPALVGAFLGLGASAAEERVRFYVLGIAYAPLVIATCWWCVAALRERAPRPLRPNTQPGAMSRNRPFLILLASYLVAAFGSNLPAALLLYYVEYVLESASANLFLVEYLLTGVVALPAWILLAKRFGKKQTWILSMLLNTGAFIGVFFLGPGDTTAYALLVFLSGLGMGATLALPSSLQADVIDYDELLTGQRREGHYIGVWAVARKAAAALGVGVALPVLGLAGYVPNVPQSPDVVFTLRVLYAAVPSVCNLVAIGIALGYPIARAQHTAILAGIQTRRRGESVADPLRPDVILGATP
jgi:GPH family glycoside/pentoside/hexuronide:cation symporter